MIEEIKNLCPCFDIHPFDWFEDLFERSIDLLKGLDAPMAGHGGPKRGDPMDLQHLEKFREGVSKLNDNELARQYRYLHGKLTLAEGVPTPNAESFRSLCRFGARRTAGAELPRYRRTFGEVRRQVAARILRNFRRL